MAVVLFSAIVSSALAANPPRWLAVFADGTRVEGEKISDWGGPSQTPKLDNTSLGDKNRPLRWLCDRSLPPSEPRGDSPGFVEFTSGDRLPGRVVAFEKGAFGASADQPPHLLLVPEIPLNSHDSRASPQLRVLSRYVRRVVWGGNVQPVFEPGTIFCRDGRRLSYRSLRWEAESVSVLAQDGIRQVSFAEMAEVHLPQRDPWPAYYGELAVLSPDGSSGLMRIETSDGLIATTSADRFHPASFNGANSERWYHLLQPAWSLDALWVRFPAIRLRCYFAPHEVPLSRLYPTRAVQRPMLGKGWHWQADRNVQRGVLESGNQQYGWGFGVQAGNELWFDLPDTLREFRSRVGLDSLAGPGGCAKALVYLNQPSGSPLYQSPHLVGSDNVVDTGTLALSIPSGGRKSLILVADPAHQDRPPGADPLDIRDTLDWIEPMLILDSAKLQTELDKNPYAAIPAWEGWNVSVEGRPLRIRHRWEKAGRRNFEYAVEVVPEKRKLTLSSERRVTANDNWLLVQVEPDLGDGRPGEIEVRADGNPLARFDLPPVNVAVPLLVPLQPLQGRQVKLDVAYLPRAGRERLEWQALRPIPRYTRTRWTTLETVEAKSSGGATMKVQPDGSILLSGQNPPNDTYLVRTKTELADITAFRLEVLPDPSLSSTGPGRNGEGEFVLSRFSIDCEGVQQAAPRGRYVRIELLGSKKEPLSLAEVQVFSGAENVARSGKASQSSTTNEGSAERAIDNNTEGRFDARSVTHTNESDAVRWWEVDLGAAKPIERIVVWNRTDEPFGNRLSNFRVAVLDDQRRAVWEKRFAGPPRPRLELRLTDSAPIVLKSAVADFSQDQFSITSVISNVPSSAPTGWGIASPHGKTPHAAVFMTEEPIDARNALLSIKLEHLSPAGHMTIGRFRLSATADPPPVPAEPIAVEVPLLPDSRTN